MSALSCIAFIFILSIPIKFVNLAITGKHISTNKAFWIVFSTFIVFFFTIWLQNKLKGRRGI
ncbi:MAG TPA: hypothetical protein DEA43_05045 [Candidatus Moranbacteria bacterium]|nr:hypothetical protein [Candidatus Moranbacteria bacterium]